MRVVVQRVKSASCWIDGKVYSSISVGYVLLVGFTDGDNYASIDYAVKKVVNMRLFNDQHGKINLNINSVNGEILVISQFTLYGDVNNGNRPSFTKALEPIQAKVYYEYFASELQKHIKTEKGIFGSDMQIELINDGPVTIIIENMEV